MSKEVVLSRAYFIVQYRQVQNLHILGRNWATETKGSVSMVRPSIPAHCDRKTDVKLVSSTRTNIAWVNRLMVEHIMAKARFLLCVCSQTTKRTGNQEITIAFSSVASSFYVNKSAHWRSPILPLEQIKVSAFGQRVVCSL